MNNLYNILIEHILPVFIDMETLGENISIFKVLFVIVSSYIVIWFFLIMPFKICQKIMQCNKWKK